MAVIDRIADRLTGEVGYRETPVNRTKYSAELDALPGHTFIRQGSSWCGTFQDWGFWKEDALAALPVGNFWTPGAARRYHDIGRWTQAGPRRGDLAFLNRLGDHGHVGFVLEVSGGSVMTCEGNTTTAAAGSQANGGEVAIKVRPISWWAGGFGQPFYEVLYENLQPPTAQASEDIMALTAIGTACIRRLDNGRQQFYDAHDNADGTWSVVGQNGAPMKDATGEAFGNKVYAIGRQATEFRGLVPAKDHGGVIACFGQGVTIDIQA